MSGFFDETDRRKLEIKLNSKISIAFNTSFQIAIFDDKSNP